MGGRADIAPNLEGVAGGQNRPKIASAESNKLVDYGKNTENFFTPILEKCQHGAFFFMHFSQNKPFLRVTFVNRMKSRKKNVDIPS